MISFFEVYGEATGRVRELLELIWVGDALLFDVFPHDSRLFGQEIEYLYEVNVKLAS